MFAFAVQFDSLRLCFRPEAECTMTLRKPQRPGDSSSGDAGFGLVLVEKHAVDHSLVPIVKRLLGFSNSCISADKKNMNRSS